MLRDKRILVISPQPWGEIHVSKHHYAIELAKKNNQVVFLNPLKLGKPAMSVMLSPVKAFPNLTIANVTLPIPAFLRFKWRNLYDLLIDFFSSRLSKKMGGFDVVWCFDPNYFHNLKKMAPVAIYHPVDPIIEQFQIRCGKYSDVIISVSHEILKAFKQLATPQFIVNHGISEQFQLLASKNYANIESYVYHKPSRLKFGYVGNLLRKEIDWPLIYSIIGQNPHVDFNFWGPDGSGSSNLAGDDSEQTTNRIQKLKSYANVKLNGIVRAEALPQAIADMDGFLLIYKYIKGQSDRSNSHKILEFFCTGKTLVSFKVKAYESNADGLLVMPQDDNDDAIPLLFHKVVGDISRYNNRHYAKRRLAFALDCTYEKNLNRIETILFKGVGS
jgi:hypothetical protein